jgi:DNA (cytosine-5)-methyltransferase 1
MTAAGQCWELPTLERRISGTDSGCAPNGETFWHTTPTVCGNYNRKGLSERSGDGLATAVMKWPTPTAHNAKEGGFPAEYERNTPTLAAQAGGSLNPTWVEWLMGWPLGWTDLKPSETDKSHCAQPQRGNY